MDTEQFSKTFPCPKCGIDRGADANCMRCDWKRVEAIDPLPPQPKRASVGRTIVTVIVAIVCASLGYVTGVLLAILGDALMHPGQRGEQFFGAAMIGVLFLGPLCLLAAGINALVRGYHGSHLFRFLGIMILLAIVPIVALMCLKFAGVLS